ncbi:MAG: type II toxin-antitoxin system RelB/DinJ family antitoxin [Lachnospiraceae bacterium]|nr:type II toxin-antitoxin system RelB/DinJ family antitoxin [Lachnospiraceae bacterium]
MQQITLRLDEQLKKEVEAMCESIGMNLNTFFTIYAKKAVKEQRIPFDITTDLTAEEYKAAKNLVQHLDTVREKADKNGWLSEEEVGWEV